MWTFPFYTCYTPTLHLLTTFVIMSEAIEKPAVEENVQNSSTVREGKAEIIFPSSNEVFYNPVQEFNRDLSSAVIRLFAEEFAQKKKEKATRKVKKRGDMNEGDRETSKGDDEVMTEPRGSADYKKCSEQKEKAGVGITVLEALAASGLRSVRYALEIPGVKNIIANDISADAFKLIQRNIAHNKVGHVVTPSQQDASLLMYKCRYPLSSRFNVIDIDPYGSASPFLDAAVQSISDGGFLLVTCTDMGVLCGNHSEACFGKYGGMSLRAKFCHEMALRLVLSSLESHANRYRRHIVPLLSMSVDFYVRLFVQVFTSAAEVKRSPSKQSLVYHCPSCGSFHLQKIGRCIEEGNSRKYPPATGPPCGQRCDECRSRFHLGGPLWSDPIHNQEFVNRLLNNVKEKKELYKTSDRMIGLLSMIQEELSDCPLYYSLDNLSGTIHCNTPSLLQFRSALIGLGYRVSISHACRTAVKTDAPNDVIWDVMRCWEKLHPVKRRKEGSPAAAILFKEPQIEASFECRPDANPSSRKQKLLRFQENPEPDWGPKARAKKKKVDESLDEKRKRLQGKRSRVPEDQKDLKQFPCKRFKKGLCTFGDQCKYSHNTCGTGVEEGDERREKAGEERVLEEEDHNKRDVNEEMLV